MTRIDSPPGVETLRRFAFAYVQRGFKVVPVWGMYGVGVCACRRPSCKSPGRHPMSMLVGRHGYKNASDDLYRISAWLESGWEENNLGVVLPPDHFCLHVNGEHGLSELRRLQAQKDGGSLPRTRIAGRGQVGLDLLFKLPEGVFLTNARRGLGATSLFVTAGERGFVVAPPSLAPDGHACQWRADTRYQPIAVAPDWLVTLLTRDDGGVLNTTVQLAQWDN